MEGNRSKAVEQEKKQADKKKTVLILDLRKDCECGNIISERLSTQDFAAITVCGDRFSSVFEQVIDEFLNKYIGLKKAQNVLSSAARNALSILPLPKRESLAYYKKMPLHNKIKNAILRYNPDLILCLSPEALKGACAYREYVKGHFIAGALIDGYYPDKRFAVKQADFLIVDNYDIKQQFIAYGINEEKIFTSPVPVSPASEKQLSREDALKQFELDDKPSVFIHTGSLGDERFKKVLADIGLGDKVNILIYCGQNQRLERFAEELYKPWIRVVGEEDVPVAVGLCDMAVARPQASVIAPIIYMEKIVFGIFATGTEERHTQDYLGYDIIVPCKDIAQLKRNILHFIEDNKKYDDRLNHIRAAKAAEPQSRLNEILLEIINGKEANDPDNENAGD
ncbi:MAG: hypothetical protein ACOYIQ_00165 [Christensenellales bacterium]|jgi:hypothetical protein